MNAKLVTLVTLLALLFAAHGQMSSDLSLELVAEGFVSPVQVTAPMGDDRLFVVDRPGQIYIVTADGELLDEPFLDISDRIVPFIEFFDERGLLGLAFHPNYAENGLFYVFYSTPLQAGAPANWDHTTRISEFSLRSEIVFAQEEQEDLGPNRADANSERVLLEIHQPNFNHNGGAIAFGPDGYLYIAVGDGGGADDVALGHPPIGHGQDITTLLGNILRIDVDRGWPGYAIPPSNPLIGREGRDEIFAWGFRNPWRMSFDRSGNHVLMVATNGQNLFEAIYNVDGAGNYSWNIKEGTHCFSPATPNDPPASCPSHDANGWPLLDPVIEYPHLENQGDSPVAGISVIGGYVYRGAAMPELQGTYIFGDWSKSFSEPMGQLFLAAPTDEVGALWHVEQVMELESFVLGFGEDAAGEVYVLTTDNTGPTGDTGKVYRIVGQ